jgi:hypothetical protein
MGAHHYLAVMKLSRVKVADRQRRSMVDREFEHLG